MSKTGSVSNLKSELPHINNIIPNMATVLGGTRLCLEGRNLGLGKSDIRDLTICDVDLMDSIEFESDTRIYVTTKATTPGKGDLLIETGSGGTFVAKNVFTFVDKSGVGSLTRNGSLRETPPSPNAIPPSPARDPPEPAPQPAPRKKKLSSVESSDDDIADIDFSKMSDKYQPSVKRSSSQTQVSSPDKEVFSLLFCLNVYLIFCLSVRYDFSCILYTRTSCLKFIRDLILWE